MGARRSLRSRLSWSASLVVAIWVVVCSVAGNLLLGAVLAREADGVLRARAGRPRRRGHRGERRGHGRRHPRRPGTRHRHLDPGSRRHPGGAPGGQLGRAGSPGRRAQRSRVAGRRHRERRSRPHAGAARARFRAAGRHGGDEHVPCSLPAGPAARAHRDGPAALLLLVVVHVVLRLNVARALRPVQQMSAQAARWSADDIDRRFGRTPRPQELAELAETLDGVLNRLSAVVPRSSSPPSCPTSSGRRWPACRPRSTG